MTVGELVAKLQHLPQHLTVVTVYEEFPARPGDAGVTTLREAFAAEAIEDEEDPDQQIVLID